MKIVKLLILGTTVLASVAFADTTSFESELASIQEQWAVANYETPAGEARKHAFEALSTRAQQLAQSNPQRAEALIWEGIVLSTYAGVKGGLGALSLAKQSRKALESALALDPNALQGSAYTSLGALYSKVPGFPIGFGDDKKARELLQKALTINPDGIDSNYFYAEFLCDQGECVQAIPYLKKAAQAPMRPGRELADAGRRREVDALLAKAKAHS